MALSRDETIEHLAKRICMSLHDLDDIRGHKIAAMDWGLNRPRYRVMAEAALDALERNGWTPPPVAVDAPVQTDLFGGKS